MDEQALRSLVIIGYYAIACLLCCGVSMVVIGLFTKYRINERFFSLGRIVGSLEQVMYIAAILIGRPEFIGVWLVIKAFKLHQADLKLWNLYLVGTSISLILAVITAILIQQTLPAPTPLPRWSLPLP